ncbi:hypothetical protein FF2_026898 [Malus domestica]
MLFSFRDCCSTTYLRNRSVEILATVALVQAIQEAQNPPATVPQEDIGKYIKILGEALQLSQPINSNSISVRPIWTIVLYADSVELELFSLSSLTMIHMLSCRNWQSTNASARTRKTRAEICKVTGLARVPLRKVHKYLLENWEDLLPSNYAPAEHSLPL